jgi:hypothetical protein
MGELAVGAIDRTPRFDQLEDRLFFPGQQPMHRRAERSKILQGALGPQPSPPAMHSDVADTDQPARPGL